MSQVAQDVGISTAYLNTYGQCQKPCSKWPKVNGNQSDKRGSFKHPEIK